MSDKNWIPFWFEGNEAWGWIDTPEKFDRIKKAYSDAFEKVNLMNETWSMGESGTDEFNLHNRRQ